MSKSLDELLTKLPEWLGEFTRTLAHPSRVLAEQLSAATPADGEAGALAPGKPVQDGAAFLILSFAVAAGVAIAFPVASMASLDAASPDSVLARSAVVLRHLFVFLAAAAIVHGASKLLGNRRLISLWPAWGGPVLHDGLLYFGCLYHYSAGFATRCNYFHYRCYLSGQYGWNRLGFGYRWNTALFVPMEHCPATGNHYQFNGRHVYHYCNRQQWLHHNEQRNYYRTAAFCSKR